MQMGRTMGVGSVPVMALMMLPSALPAIARRARAHDGVFDAPLFAGSYLGVWALIALVMLVAYRPFGAVTAGALIVGAGLYELTPLKRDCRRRCLERVRSGAWFGAFCLGSSIGLMLVLVAVNVMSIVLMIAIGAVVLAQKLIAPHAVLDRSLALVLAVFGILTVAV
jgi:predicted metal-binding membrane protein